MESSSLSNFTQYSTLFSYPELITSIQHIRDFLSYLVGEDARFPGENGLCDAFSSLFNSRVVRVYVT